MNSIHAVMNYLVERCHPNASAIEALADVFDRLIWCLDDNGAELLEVREAWLASSDKRRVVIALSMNETFPFKHTAMMEDTLAQVAQRWPDLAQQCASIVEARRNQEN